MSDPLKGIKANASFRAYYGMELRANDIIRKATQEMYERVREKSASQIKAHMDWVVQCALTFGYKIDDLELVTSSNGIESTCAVIVKSTTQTLGWAEAKWFHDELQITTSSIYGTEPEDKA